jgi:hypothetical protein
MFVFFLIFSHPREVNKKMMKKGELMAHQLRFDTLLKIPGFLAFVDVLCIEALDHHENENHEGVSQISGIDNQYLL